MMSFSGPRLPAVGTALLVLAGPVLAHPLGNDSITHFNVLYVGCDRFETDLVLDIAETPSAVLLRDEIDANRDGDDSTAEQESWLNRQADRLAARLHVQLDGTAIPLRPIAPDAGDGTTPTRLIVQTPGVAGMNTYRLVIRYVAEWPQLLAPGPHAITYEDMTFPERRGLMRIFLRPTVRVTINSPRPPFWDECPVSPFLYEQYDPADLPAERSASFTFRVEPRPQSSPATLPAGPAATGQSPDYRGILTDPRNDPARQSQARRDADKLIALLQRPWGLTVLATVTVLCFAWGAAHALMPGHAKTLVAACLISRHGSWWHAVLLAVVVTFTHTALVVALGAILWVYQRTHPQLGPTLQIWLGIIAGLLVAGMGLTLLWRAIIGRPGHHHHYDHPHSHEHPHPHPHDRQPDQITTRLLLLLGITGGMVPCPTAAIIMLLGIGAKVIPGALYAVGIFSLGLALTLMAVGFAALGSRRFAARLMADTSRHGELSRAGQWLLNRLLPAVSGLAVLALGSAIAAHYAYYLHTGLALFAWMQ